MEFIQGDIYEIVHSLGGAAEAFDGKRILITGGRGFLGRYFCEVFAELNARGCACEVLALDNLITSGISGADVPKRPHFNFVNHDVTKLFYPEKKVDFILHAAGIASPFHYRRYPLETLEVATTGLKNSLDIARSHKAKIAFFSSSEIYGDPDSKHVPTKESYKGHVACLGPRSCYDESKRLGETLVQIYHQQYGVHGTIIRPFNVFGPGMQKTDYRVLPNFAAKVLLDESLQVYGTGKQTRTFCYVTDAIRGFLQVLMNGVAGEPYNIGNPTPEISVLELVRHIESVLGREVKKIVTEHPDTYPADEPNRRCPDITKAMQQVNYSPAIPLEEGLRRFFAWAEQAYKDDA
jgi:UDP-glucuronate decarboxylase